jgi:hypothetical protein
MLSSVWSFSGTFLNVSNGLGFPTNSVDYYLDTNLLIAPTATGWWVSGGDGSTNPNAPATHFATNVVTVLASGGQAFKLPPTIGRFYMYRPVAKITPATNEVQVIPFAKDTGLLLFGHDQTFGIIFSNKITYPNTFVGTKQWVQVLTSSGSEIIKKMTNGMVSNTVEQGTGPPFLDNPMDPSIEPYPYILFCLDNITPADGPYEYLDSTESWFKVKADSFQMTMMFVPPGPGVPVPLRRVAWSWSGSAVNMGYGNGSYWEARRGTNVLTSTVNPDCDTTTYPVWMSFATNYLWELQQ